MKSLSRNLLGTVVAAFLITPALSAADFSAADALYDQRHKGFSQYQAAVKAYGDLITAGNLSDDELFYAVAQSNRLHIMYGDLVLRSFDAKDFKTTLPAAEMKPWETETADLTAARQKTFDRCLSAVEHINPSHSSLKDIYAGDAGIYLAQYYYWSIACLALRVEVTPLKDGPKQFADKLKDMMVPALALSNKTFEGGGIIRSLAGVKSNLAAAAFSLYAPEEAVTLLVQFDDKKKVKKMTQLFIDAHPQDPYDRSGDLFFGNYRYIARALNGKATTLLPASFVSAKAKEEMNYLESTAQNTLKSGKVNIETALLDLKDGIDTGWTATPGNIFELTLESNRINYELAEAMK